MAGACELLKWTRGHWSIENRSHYVRDVTLGEDASRIRKGSGPEVMAALRNAAIGFLRCDGRHQYRRGAPSECLPSR